MRLVCPNCEAKYEVPEDAIPETGRDVQCANCGHAWFQMRPRAAVTETVAAPPAPIAPPVAPPVAEPAPTPEPVAEPAATARPEDSHPIAEPIPEPTPEPLPAEDVIVESTPVDPPPAAFVEAATDDSLVAGDGVAAITDAASANDVEAAPIVEEVIEAAAETVSMEPGPDASAFVDEIAAVTPIGPVPAIEATIAEAVVAEEAGEAESEPEVSETAAMAAPAAYAVDESVLAILREEADREAQARRAEAAKPLETQTDLGIDSAIPVPKPVEAAVVAPAEAEAATIRRTRLPDVEEINSTLRPTETTDDEAAPADGSFPPEGRSSFRSGFLMVLTVAILGSALYGAADALAEAIPALAGPLKAYVGFVDSLRLHLDGLMQSATVAINGD